MLQRHRLTTLALLLAIVCVTAVGGWILGTQIQSPAEAAARTAPPLPSPILVPVEQRVLTTAIVTRGTARFGRPQTLAIVPSTMKGIAPIITTLPTRGLQLQEGELLLTASERPVFLLQGTVPVYRDLTPGTVGTDVQQLEHALVRLGYDPGTVDNRYDEATATAVRAWYQATGWQPAVPSAAYQAERQRLELGLTEAQAALATAEDAAVLAPLQVDVTRATAQRSNNEAAALVAEMLRQRDAVVARTHASVAETTAANAAVAAAQAAATATALEGQIAIQRAQRAQQRTERDLHNAQGMVERLAAELATVERTANGYVPADELIFVPTLPVRVERLLVAIGDPARGAALMVTNNQLAVDSQLPLSEAPLLRPGMAVTLDEPDLGVQATGVVARVAESPGTEGVDGYHVYFETAVQEATTAIDGFSLRLTIPVQSTDGAVTVVPISALQLKADGTSIVQVDVRGTLAPLVVVPGLAAEGYVAVTPVTGQLVPGQLVVVGYEAQE